VYTTEIRSTSQIDSVKPIIWVSCSPRTSHSKVLPSTIVLRRSLRVARYRALPACQLWQIHTQPARVCLQHARMIARVPQEVLWPRTDEKAEESLTELCLLAFGHGGEEAHRACRPRSSHPHMRNEVTQTTVECSFPCMLFRMTAISSFD
jgi:hypothetical protein